MDESHEVSFPFISNISYYLSNILIVEIVTYNDWCNFSSAGILSVVDDEAEESNSPFNKAICNACQTAVVWIQNQLAQNQTQDVVLDYINQVSSQLLIPIKNHTSI